MATLVLSAAGAAFGGSFGGSILGLSTMALGKAVGATVGSFVDQKLLGSGAAPVETGRVDRFRVMGSSEGASLPRCFGRIRLPGQLIWSSRFTETVSKQRVGGKATAPSQTVKQYGYTISLGIALCEGEVMRIGRIWADGQPLAQRGLTWRLHKGGDDQLPDPLIAAIEGTDQAPAYRGTAYVVFEDLDLKPFGNRIPQLNFEVFRRPQARHDTLPLPAADTVRAVALVPGTGEYALATTPVSVTRRRGETTIANVNNDRGIPDFRASFDQLQAELPGCEAVSLVVSWFADDLRIDRSELYPAVEQRAHDGDEMPWVVSGVGRGDARVVNRVEDRPLFGGTPADSSVIQAIRHMRAAGKSVMFYPFILLDLVAGNGRANPWAPLEEQPPVPWRGRMTLSLAAGQTGSPDRTAEAAAEVDRFFGRAEPGHFSSAGERVRYTGPEEWKYRRFVLHYARLCAIAGGVDAFCIGSEMRGLTQIRDGASTYPAVRQLCRLAQDVRSILGPETKISYAADWSEYFGHHPRDGSGDAIFNLDPLWAHPAVDFVGIDNYMPLSDWREDVDHLDASAGSIYSLDYLTANVAGGEGYDWYYRNSEDRAAQRRTLITDGAYGEHWLFRFKDIRNWWANAHVNRLGGVKAGQTAWTPRGKPIWFTELGCPAVDKGTNQPNVFYDPKSSESFLPYYSNGRTDDLIQQRYLQATATFWSDPDNNPLSETYGGAMVDLAHAFVWAWDARPWPDFPTRLSTWIDGRNHARGHWLNGRIAKPGLGEVVVEVCGRPGLDAVDVADVHGVLTGYGIGAMETARQSLQPLMLAFALESQAAGDRITFRSRVRRAPVALDLDRLAIRKNAPRLQRTRSGRLELAGRATVTFVRADEDYATGAVDAVASDSAEPSTADVALPVVLTPAEAQAVAERWLHEARVAQETAEFALPPSLLSVAPGDLIAIEASGRTDTYRVDQVDEAGLREVKAVRVDNALLELPLPPDEPLEAEPVSAPTPPFVEFIDLPLLQGDEAPHAPYAFAAKRPWAGPVAIYTSLTDSGFELSALVDRPATLGTLLDPLGVGQPAVWMNRGFRVRLDHGILSSRPRLDVLNGANTAALRRPERPEVEVIQFERATLVDVGTYLLSGLLRGQAGTDVDMPELWPAGTDFILIDGSQRQLELSAATAALERQARYGPAEQPPSDDSFRQTTIRPSRIGLRPYRPVHLAVRRAADRAIVLTWIRRTRIGGDGWEGEVPLAEEAALYDVRIWAGERHLRSASVETTRFVYPAVEQERDGALGPFFFDVAQVSSQFGPGSYQRIAFHD